MDDSSRELLTDFLFNLLNACDPDIAGERRAVLLFAAIYGGEPE